MYPMSKPVDN